MLIVIASTFLCRFLVVESKYSEEARKAFSKPTNFGTGLSHCYYPSDSCNVAQKHLLPTTIHSAFYLHFTVLLALL